ncbi:hypothetical protein ACIA8K_22595 [Catenuloplanes sp. NPDC051500]|uniref:hypothetical protein n=1 Tax=Catenuloplanes sp. NPDC051500 TaxID=3363959 RepID=UPI0037AF7025
MTPNQQRRYGSLIEAVLAQSRAGTEGALSADRAAQAIARAVTGRAPRARFAIGLNAAVLIRLSRLLPDRVLDRIAAASLRPYYPRVS